MQILEVTQPGSYNYVLPFLASAWGGGGDVEHEDGLFLGE